ncbi:gustatory receptor for bitter taste 66a-like [Lutzomyia longipalpis]|uniref:gustatory receptor for bitter taste 66a-like n=1 Tax=Lutzomyia longipalpis TaxID=7200 RepID=UPI002483E40D|nr:gustatory receptor for bitter taste 66a-like [Lutzomyia longipalpis]
MKNFCDESDLLDLLCICHYRTCKLMKSLNSIYAIQMLIFVIIAFMNSMSQLFYLYVAIRESYRNEIKANWSIYIYSLLYAYFQYMDLFFHAKSAKSAMKESRRTGRLLHKFPTVHVDGRLKKSVDIFSIQVVQNKLDITICGMFPLDYTLIASSLSSILSFLVIMIQFDLAV